MDGGNLRSGRRCGQRRFCWIVAALWICPLGSFGCREVAEWQSDDVLQKSANSNPGEFVAPTSAGSRELHSNRRTALESCPAQPDGSGEPSYEQEVTCSGTRPPPTDSLPSPALPVLPPAFLEYAIDLETALALAGVENPTIALAEEAVRASLAAQLAARALLLPTLEAGTSFNLHRGNLQSARGLLRDVDRQSLYVGAGALAVGAGTVAVPGVRVTAHLADAIFEPQAARQRVASRRFDARATQNAVLLDVTTRYFALVGAEALLQALRLSESELAEVVRLTANFARTGQAREGDAERARSEAFLLHVQEQQAQEEVAVAAADLARLLDLDPAVRLRGPGGTIPLIQLVDPCDRLENLIQIALGNRPEIGARTAEVAVNETHLRQERIRPLVPLLSVGFSAGGFGGGSDQADTRFGHFNARTDFDVLAVWSVRNFGLGDVAVQRRLRAEVDQALAERVRVLDQIRREVAEAYALAAARRLQVDVARRRVETAQEGYRLDLTRAKNLEGHPIEVLNSVNLLSAARQDWIRALIGYNVAQFQLFVALGQPPRLTPPIELQMSGLF
jgi:outer membrane protein TolC